MIVLDQLQAAYSKVRGDLLAERTTKGHWIGELSTSALSTATAVSALAIAVRESKQAGEETARYSSLVKGGISWLAGQQNEDGGWGDTDQSHSNIATTMLVIAAMHLADVASEHSGLLKLADAYVELHGGIQGLRDRFGIDKTFAVPILTNCALAGLVPWREVSQLPFPLACFPQRIYHLLQFPVVSYAIPALVAIGQARYFNRPPWNPFYRLLLKLTVPASTRVLERIQPESGGYLEAIPLTSFVVMSLAATGRVDHAVTRQGLKFLASSVRPDGSWPIDTNLATWTTTLALTALANSGEDISHLSSLDWLLECQNTDIHPFTGAAPGGWGWSDLSGAVPDADDTPGALLALAAWNDLDSITEVDRKRIHQAAALGIDWLLGLQNRDGGWPTFCRGWGKLPFDRSGADLTAHVLRALQAWRSHVKNPEILPAIERGLSFLERSQRADGSWLPLWFGNQDDPNEENPVYGTAKVILAYRDLGREDDSAAQRAKAWLRSVQRSDGGWGTVSPNGATEIGTSSLEETSLAVEALLSPKMTPETQVVVKKGLVLIIQQIDQDFHHQAAPIGFYFAKLWYYERLYPLTFTLSAIGQATSLLHRTEEQVTASS